MEWVRWVGERALGKRKNNKNTNKKQKSKKRRGCQETRNANERKAEHNAEIRHKIDA